MNVYDFDNTIYKGDSTLDFFKFLLKKKPLLICFIPYQVCTAVGYILNIYTKTQFKEKFYIFLNYIDNIDEYLIEFWELHMKKINIWYLEQKTETDIIISASPEFLLKYIGEELGVEIIASKVNKSTGKYDGENCYGKEKLIRWEIAKGNKQKIEKFYSDSMSDRYLANKAQKAYIVKGNCIKEWGK